MQATSFSITISPYYHAQCVSQMLNYQRENVCVCVCVCVKEKKTERVEEEILSYVSDIFYNSDQPTTTTYRRDICVRLYSYANVYSLLTVLFLR